MLLNILLTITGSLASSINTMVSNSLQVILLGILSFLVAFVSIEIWWFKYFKGSGLFIVFGRVSYKEKK